MFEAQLEKERNKLRRLTATGTLLGVAVGVVGGIASPSVAESSKSHPTATSPANGNKTHTRQHPKANSTPTTTTDNQSTGKPLKDLCQIPEITNIAANYLSSTIDSQGFRCYNLNDSKDTAGTDFSDNGANYLAAGNQLVNETPVASAAYSSVHSDTSTNVVYVNIYPDKGEYFQLQKAYNFKPLSLKNEDEAIKEGDGIWIHGQVFVELKDGFDVEASIETDDGRNNEPFAAQVADVVVQQAFLG